MLGEDARSFRSKPKMAYSTRIIWTVQFLHRILWNRRRTDWVRVEYFPGLNFIGNFPEDPKRPARSRKKWTWTFWRSNYLHVNVQWHGFDEDSKFRKVHFEFWTRQELREEVLARTLVNPRPRRRKEVVRNSQQYTSRKKGFHPYKNGGTLQRNLTSSIQGYLCLEPWNSEKNNCERWDLCWSRHSAVELRRVYMGRGPQILCVLVRLSER